MHQRGEVKLIVKQWPGEMCMYSDPVRCLAERAIVPVGRVLVRPTEDEVSLRFFNVRALVGD
jgi:hypothetical protein